MERILVATARIKLKILRRRSNKEFNIDEELDIIEKELKKIATDYRGADVIPKTKMVNDMLDSLL